MPKIYTRSLIDTQVVTVNAGDYNLVAIGFPEEAVVTSLICKQQDASEGGGTAVPFRAYLFRGKNGLATGSQSAALPHDQSLFYVAPAIHAGKGCTAAFFGESFSYSSSESAPSDNLFLLIEPIGAAGTTKWEVQITGEDSVGGQ